jgi:hypothetical protein
MSRSLDQLSKALATGTGRRQALRGLLTGAVGAAIATVMPARTVEAASNEEKLAGRICSEMCADAFPNNRLVRNACADSCKEIFDDDVPLFNAIILGPNVACVGVCLNGTVLINSTVLPEPIGFK